MSPWNRWAVEWADNELPANDELLPTIAAGEHLAQLRIHANQPGLDLRQAVQFLFCLMLLLAMFDAARRSGNFSLVPGVAIAYWLLVALLRYRMLSSGYADVPLAFFAWMPVYALVLAGISSAPKERRGKRWTQRSKWLLVGGLCAAGAALTKQMGLYAAAVYPLLVWLWLGEQPFRATVRSLFRLCLVITVLVAPWYIYKFVDIRSGHDANNTLHLLLECHDGRSLHQRAMHAGTEVAAATTLPGAAMLLAAVAVSLGDRRSRSALGPVRRTAGTVVGCRLLLRSPQPGDARAICGNGRRHRVGKDRLPGRRDVPTKQDGPPGTSTYQ